MTDIDFETDPVLDAHLRRTLREVAGTVTTDAVSDDKVVRLVTTQASNPRPHRWAWLGVAAAAGALAGASLMAVAARNPKQTAVPAASTSPLADLDLFSLAHECHAAHGEIRANRPDEFSHLPRLPEVDDATVLLFGPTENDRQRTVIVASDIAFYTCSVTGGGRALVDDNNVFGVQSEAPLLSTDVQVLEVSSWGTDPDVVPGVLSVIGRAGNAVSSLELQVADGSSAPAELNNGWFLFDADVGPGVPMSDARLAWETTGGESLSARLDLLDQSTAYEECAMEQGCVESRLEQLYVASVESGRDAQSAILADLYVTPAERVRADHRFADCFNAAETGATATVHGPGMIAIGTMNLEDEGDHERMQAVRTLCAAAHTDYVAEAWNLLDAQRRVAEG